MWREKASLGRIVIAYRTGYRHFGVVTGEDEITHYTDRTGKTKHRARICVTSFDEFEYGDEVRLLRLAPRFSPSEIAARAASRVGESKYSLVFRNCEHFARWCVTGKARSSQVERVAALLAGVLLGVGAAIVGKRE